MNPVKKTQALQKKADKNWLNMAKKANIPSELINKVKSRMKGAYGQ